MQTVLVVAADYEMLLQLDQADNSAVPAACEEQMASLPAFKFEGPKVELLTIHCAVPAASHTATQQVRQYSTPLLSHSMHLHLRGQSYAPSVNHLHGQN